MTRHSPISTAPDGQIDGTELLVRILAEFDRATELSREMQAALHEVPLDRADAGTRRALQGADRLTQSLECLRAALEGVATAQNAEGMVDRAAASGGVYLQELRDKLFLDDPVGEPGTSPGVVDLF